MERIRRMAHKSRQAAFIPAMIIMIFLWGKCVDELERRCTTLLEAEWHASGEDSPGDPIKGEGDDDSVFT